MKIINLLILIMILPTIQIEARPYEIFYEDTKRIIEKRITENDPAEIIAKYIKAVGGKEKLDQIRNSTMTMEAKFQGAKIVIKGISDQDNQRVLQETTVMGNLAQKTVIANGKGKMMTMGQEQELNEDMMEMMKSQAYVFPELHYQAFGYELENRGIENVDGEEANVLVITAINGMETLEYYSIKTGLKLLTSSTVTGEIGYSDYQEVDGVMFPMTLTINNPMLPSAMIGKVTAIKFNQKLSDEDFK